MLISALARRASQLASLLPSLRSALELLNDPANLSFAQGVMLAAAALDMQPEIILDLGTGMGNSAVVFGLAARYSKSRVYTFDLFPSWDGAREKLNPELRLRVDDVVTAMVEDLTLRDFAPLLVSANRVLIFWDAHGYTIAESVLGKILPMIAERKHFVICHDMGDNRFGTPGSYEGKGYWRAVDGASASTTTAYANLGFLNTRVEQAIPIMDFCWRNEIELHSLDWELHRTPGITVREQALPRLGLQPDISLNMMYFTMNETTRRFFPGYT